MLTNRPVAGHQFSAELMLLFINLVLSGPVSQRATESVLEIFADSMNWDQPRLPCANTGRLWMARLGLYALHCEKPQADDWLWMMDHTVQLGPWKCLVIVGVRLSVWQSLDRPLRHEDLSLLNLTPMKSATKEAVAKQLEQTALKVGAPTAVLSDEATELKGGMALYQRQLTADKRPPHLHDIKHKAAILLKKQLASPGEWDEFVRHSTRMRLNVSLTDLAFTNPPRLRNKARFMNLEMVVRWGRKILQFVKRPRPLDTDTPLNREKLEAKAGWLRDFEQPLEKWNELLAVIEETESYVRRYGYHPNAPTELAKILRPVAKKRASKKLMNSLLAFIRTESSKLKAGQRVLGHTEVLESLLGKYKQIQGRHSQGGMTASLLNIGAIVVSKTPDTIRAALQAVPTKMITQWVRDSLGQTIASQQKMAFK